MPRLHAFELVPDEAGRAAVLRDWQALRDAGLPSQLDHKGMTNTPHVTLLAGERLPPDQEAVDLVGPLLPVRVRVAGVLLLGGSRVTVARALDVDDALLSAVLGLRAGAGDLQHRGWLPHLTLGRRIRRVDVPAALEAVGTADVELVLTALRRWDPDEGTVTSLI
ncbi:MULTISPECIES: 2'-5' RNA ligase family protein [unclassified Nocardioides]|uniref:2'-5' RNA ligase family protein n=1 Tax=unclassified Nocardioides TaxID=2615069 RepID=UPI00301546B5